MKVSDIMSKAHVIDKSGRISDALDMMQKYHVRRLVVKNKDQVCGVITLRGICGELGSRRKYNHPPSSFHVADAVSNSYSLVEPGDDAERAISALKEVDCVIVSDGSVQGEVTASDIIKHAVPAGPVSSIMKVPVVAQPDSRAVFIRKLMMDKGVSRVPILGGDRLMGIVSETDIAMAMRGVKRRSSQKHQDNNVEAILASDIMSINVLTVMPETAIREAAAIMTENDVGALPVLDSGKRLIGIITRKDIVRAL